MCCTKPASISGALPLVRLPSGTTRCSRGLASSDATALIGRVLHVPPLPPRTATLGSARFVLFQFLCFATTPLRPARVNIFNLLFPDQQMSPYGIIHELLPNQVHLRKAISPSLATKRGVEVMEVRGRYLFDVGGQCLPPPRYFFQGLQSAEQPRSRHRFLSSGALFYCAVVMMYEKKKRITRRAAAGGMKEGRKGHCDKRKI